MGLQRRYPLAPRRQLRRAPAVVNLAGRGTGSAAQAVSVTQYLSTAAPNILSAVGASAGVATVAAVGASVVAGAGASAGSTTIAGTGAATFAASGAAAGASSASAVGSTVTTVVSGAGASAGTATVAAEGASTWSASGAAAGVATSTADGASTVAADASAAGSATAAAVGVALVVSEAAGASDGVSTASGVGTFVATLAGDGAASGSSSADAFGVGIGTIPLVGTSTNGAPTVGVSAAVVVKPSALATRAQVWDAIAQAQAMPIRIACIGSAAFGAPQIVGSVYLAGGIQLGASSRARIGSSGSMSVRIDLVPVGGAAIASFAATLSGASYADAVVTSAVYLPAGWYDIELHAVSAGTAYFRGLHLAA